VLEDVARDGQVERPENDRRDQHQVDRAQHERGR
jgi:hypothetical protein